MSERSDGKTTFQGAGGVFAAASLGDFFREVFESARARRRLSMRGETEVYLVHLLVEFVQSDQLFAKDADGRLAQEPLAFMLKRAVEAPKDQRARHLKRMGDTALYVSGFFSDSLQRQLVDVDYYASMGGRAYDVLSGMSPGHKAGVFGELATKFVQVVDLFSEISERAAITSNAGILRLYERYVRTGSERLRQLLEDKGVVPVPTTLVVQ